MVYYLWTQFSGAGGGGSGSIALSSAAGGGIVFASGWFDLWPIMIVWNFVLSI